MSLECCLMYYLHWLFLFLFLAVACSILFVDMLLCLTIKQIGWDYLNTACIEGCYSAFVLHLYCFYWYLGLIVQSVILRFILIGWYFICLVLFSLNWLNNMIVLMIKIKNIQELMFICQFWFCSLELAWLIFMDH